MPIYAEVEGVGRLEFPDGTDPAVIQATVKRVVQQKPQAPAESKPYTIGDKVLNSGVGGFIRGLRDPIDAGAQLLARGVNTLGGPDSMVQNVEGANKEAEQDYRQNWRQGQDVGMDWGRVLGNVALTSILTRGAGAPTTAAELTLPKLAWQGAKQGAGGGILQPVQNATSNLDFWRQKAAQAGIGAGAGAVAGPLVAKAIEGTGKVVNRGVDAIKGWLAPKTNDEALRLVAEALKAQGINPSSVSQKTLESLALDAKDALGKTGVLNQPAIRRAADFREAGIDEVPSSWLTRDPVAWTTQANLAGAPGGERLMRAQTAATNKITGLVERNRPAGATQDAYELGRDAAAGVQKSETSLKRTVDGLYQLFRDTAPNADGNAARFNDRLAKALDEAMAGGQLPGDIVSRLQAINSGKFPLNVSTLYQMQKAANALNTKGDNVALGIFGRAVDDELTAMADDGGKFVGIAHDILLAGRSMAKERFKLQEAVPAFKAAADGTLAPDDFFRKYVAGAKVGELQRMLQNVNDPAALVAMRAQMVDFLKTAAIGTAKEENPTLAQAMFNKAIAAPGMPQKLRLLLGEQGLADVQRAGRLAEAVIKAPSGNKVNTSNTSQAVANLAARFMKNANMGPFSDMAANIALKPIAKVSADRAFQPAGGLLAQGSQLATMDPRRARLIAGLLAGPSATWLTGDLSR